MLCQNLIVLKNVAKSSDLGQHQAPNTKFYVNDDTLPKVFTSNKYPKAKNTLKCKGINNIKTNFFSFLHLCGALLALLGDEADLHLEGVHGVPRPGRRHLGHLARSHKN